MNTALNISSILIVEYKLPLLTTISIQPLSLPIKAYFRELVISSLTTSAIDVAFTASIQRSSPDMAISILLSLPTSDNAFKRILSSRSLIETCLPSTASRSISCTDEMLSTRLIVSCKASLTSEFEDFLDCRPSRLATICILFLTIWLISRVV